MPGHSEAVQTVVTTNETGDTVFEKDFYFLVIGTIFVPILVGIICHKKLRRNRQADLIEEFRHAVVAEALRNEKPVVPYPVIAGMGGIIGGLLVHFIWVLGLFTLGRDLYQYRLALMPTLSACAIGGFVVAGFVDWIMAKRSSG